MNDRDAVLAPLPDAIRRRLVLYAELLQKWQPTINLVSPKTLPQLWARHISDSMQVQAAVPEARAWVDLGSGGGFPGLVTAILLADHLDARVHCVESDKRKCAFLRAVARETGAPATVHAIRIEEFVATHEEKVDAVSARALAPLPRLVDYAARFLDAGAIGVFPQGEAGPELTGSPLDPRVRFDTLPSRLRDGSTLLLVRAVSPGGDR